MKAEISNGSVAPFLFNLVGVAILNYFISCLVATLNVLRSITILKAMLFLRD
jgi:hypothetical protein